MKIAVIGTGYVGLVTGACLANVGYPVVCVDKNLEKLRQLENNIIPISEPGLDELIEKNVKEGRLTFSSDTSRAIKDSFTCFIAVGTPSNEDGSCNTENIINVANEIKQSINGYKIIVNKSTAPVGTVQEISRIIKGNKNNYPFDVVANPEFLRQGSAVKDFMNPDRIIVGSSSKLAVSIMTEVYSSFSENNSKLVIMDTKSAEMVKYTANSFLATKISFINEIACLCEKVGANIELVRKGISSDPRIGDKFLCPGVGYGGSCLPKDIRALISTGEHNDCEMPIIKATNYVNLRQAKVFTEKIIKRFEGNLRGKTFGIWGLSFKPGTDDVREAPSISVIKYLKGEGAQIRVYDPKAMENTKDILRDAVLYSHDMYSTLKEVDALIILTEWEDFKTPDFGKMRKLMKTTIIFDGRNLYSKDTLKKELFELYQIGVHHA